MSNGNQQREPDPTQVAKRISARLTYLKVAELSPNRATKPSIKREVRESMLDDIKSAHRAALNVNVNTTAISKVRTKLENNESITETDQELLRQFCHDLEAAQELSGQPYSRNRDRSSAEPADQLTDDELRKLFAELKADFNEQRHRDRPVKAVLTHRATNVSAEVDSAFSMNANEMVASFGVGSREPKQNLSENGKPLYVDTPIIDAVGNPILDPESGRGLDVIMPAFRRIDLYGDIDAVARLQKLTERGGRLACRIYKRLATLLDGWRFTHPEEIWWALLFEIAWAGKHIHLAANRELCLTGKGGASVSVPYDLEQLRRLSAEPPFRESNLIPKAWLDRLPDFFISEIEDATSACADLAGIFAGAVLAEPVWPIANPNVQTRASETQLPTESGAEQKTQPLGSADFVKLDNELSPAQYEMIQVLFHRGAFGRADGISRDLLIRACELESPPDSYYPQVAKLKREFGLTESVTGKHGGIWLSRTGRRYGEYCETQP